MDMDLGEWKGAVERRIERWAQTGFLSDLWDRNPALWSDHPVEEISDRLGWLDLPGRLPETAARLRNFAREVGEEGIDRVLLLGMGGSSLAPEMAARIFGPAPGCPGLSVLDSTHPDAVAALTEDLDPRRLLVVVSSKSGTTLETMSLMEYFWNWVGSAAGDPGERFCAVTDPGSPLSELAVSKGFRRVFHAPSDVGGRFSALSVFGLLPAVLLGVDLDEWGRRAAAEIESNRPYSPVSESRALALGAALGELAAFMDKLTIRVSSRMEGFPDWIEQLVAESLGKQGKGWLPVIDEPEAGAGKCGRDRFFVTMSLREEAENGMPLFRRRAAAAGFPVLGFELEQPECIAAAMVRWEIAVAAAGSIMGVHPFNQPDVQLSKSLAREAMAAPEAPGENDSDALVTGSSRLRDGLSAWLDSFRPGDYVGIQAFLAPFPATREALRRIRKTLRGGEGRAVTMGFGPRFLHSTGQYHKGGPGNGLFLQLIDEPRRDLAVPGRGYTFGRLIRAQAQGDYRALRESGRRVVRVNLGGDVAAGLAELHEILSERSGSRGG